MQPWTSLWQQKYVYLIQYLIHLWDGILSYLFLFLSIIEQVSHLLSKVVFDNLKLDWISCSAHFADNSVERKITYKKEDKKIQINPDSVRCERSRRRQCRSEATRACPATSAARTWTRARWPSGRRWTSGPTPTARTRCGRAAGLELPTNPCEVAQCPEKGEGPL